MPRQLKDFITDFSEAVLNGNAAVFAGAGLSAAAGYVNWRDMLRDIANRLRLDVDIENDLIAVAQYHVNEQLGNRGDLNNLIVREFARDASETENHRILARLPIRTYWTTNYDRLIEKTLEKVPKRVDVKLTQESLATSMPHADAVVYKMHGDVSDAAHAVLTKDDYEHYDSSHQLFSIALRGDLVSKTFAFIGFSFTDPNLDTILSRIRVLLRGNQRHHYCFMKKVCREDPLFRTDEDFCYARVKQDLQIRDLKRFNITVVLVDDYPEITEALRRVEQSVASRNVLISGSAHIYGKWPEERALSFVRNLSGTLIRKGYNIATGFGLGIGGNVITGALEAIISGHDSISDRLFMRPFPQGIQDPQQRRRLWTAYRSEMVSVCGAAIFVFGNKLVDGRVVEADGMLEEYKIARERGLFPIPIGRTGFATLRIWEEVLRDFDTIVKDKSLRSLYQQLNSAEVSDEDLISAVIRILSQRRNADEYPGR